jgi:hypothetical protein
MHFYPLFLRGLDRATTRNLVIPGSSPMPMSAKDAQKKKQQCQHYKRKLFNRKRRISYRQETNDR